MNTYDLATLLARYKVKATMGKKKTARIQDVEGTKFDTLLNNIDELSNRFSTFGIVGAEVIRKITDSVIELGDKMVHSLVLDQIQTGFSKYEQTTKDVVAIMNQAEKDEETVNDYIKTLSWYSDVTSFDANSMTAALKTFAAQGIDLEEALPVIMGIGNSVTFAGQAAKEGSAAFDAYSKAISAGYLGNREWITLQRGLGVATLGLKKQILQAAQAAGTLTYKGDGVWETMQGLEVTVENFQTTLGDQKGKWLNTDVIMSVFGKEYGSYTQKLADFTREYEEQNGVVLTLSEAIELLGDNTDELGIKYLLSATQARTFTEAIDAVKDASSTVWKNVFTDIFGTTTEAITLWTNFSDKLFDIFVTPLSNMEQVLAGWKELGGREVLIDSLARAFGSLEKAIAPVKDAFRNIFPSIRSKDLIDITNNFANLTFRLNSFFSTEFNTEGLRKTFEGLFAAVDILKEGFKALFDAASPIGEIFATTLNKILEITGSLGNYVVKLRDSIKEHNSFKDALSGVKDGLIKFGDALKAAFTGKEIQYAGIFGKVLEGIQFIFDRIKSIGIPVLGLLKDGVKTVFDVLASGIKNTSIETLFNLLKGGIFTNIALNLSTFSRKLKEGFGLWDMISDIRWTFEVLGASIKAFCTNIQANLLLKIAAALAILTVSLSSLSAIPEDDLGRALGGIAVLMGGLTAMFKIVSANTSILKNFGDVGNGVLKLAAGLLVLAGAVKILTGIPWEKMLDGLAGLAAIGTGLLIFLKYANFKSIGIKAGIGIMALATGIAILASAVKSLSKANPDNVGIALVALGGIMLGLGLLISKVRTEKLLSIGAALLSASVGIAVVSASLRLLGTMNIEQVGVSLLAMAGAMVVFTGALNAAKDTLSGAAAILIMAGALAILTPTLIALGHASPTTIGMALLYLAGAFTVFGLAVKVFDTFGIDTALTKVGLGMLALGAGTVVLAAGLAILANQPIEGIATGLLAIIGALTIFGVAASVLSTAVVPMLIIAGVLAAIGAASAIFGGGVLVIAAGISGLAAALSLIGPLTGVFFLVAAGITAFGAATLVVAGGVFVLALALNGFAAAAMLLAPTIPIILKLAVAIGVLALSVIAIIAAIKYLAGNLTIGDDLAVIGEKVKTGFHNILVSLELFFLNALKALLEDIPILGDKIASSLDAKIKAIEEEEMSAKRGEAMAENYSEGIIKGMDAKAEKIYLEGQELATQATKGLDSKKDNWFSYAVSYVTSFIKGLNSKESSVTSAARQLARNAEKAMQYELGIESPSKDFEYMGEMSGEGYSEGVEESTPGVLDSVKDMATGALGTLADTVGSNLELPAIDASNFTSSIPDSLSGLMDGSLDLSSLADLDESPVITPVLDLSEIQNGATDINSILNGQTVSANVNGLTSTNAQYQFDIQTDLAAIRDDISRLYGVHEGYVNKANSRMHTLGDEFRSSIEGLGVYMDSAKVGRIVDQYQSNVRRAAGV